MTNISRTTLRELKKRYLNILKKCFLANLMAFAFVLPSMAETVTNPATNEELLEALLDPTKRVMITIPTLQYEINLNGKKMTLPVTSELAGGKLNANSHSVKFTGASLFEGNKIEAKDARSTGGAVYMQKGMTFENVDFKNNEVKNTNNIADGGAIFNALGTLTITGHANFIGNKVDGYKEAHGGALYNSGGTVRLNTVNFENNYAKADTLYAIGAGLYSVGVNSDVIISGHSIFKNNIVEGNIMASSAGIYNIQGKMVLSSADFVENAVVSNKNIQGGVINTQTDLTFMGFSSFKRNTATGNGNVLGIAISNSGNLSLKNAEFIENKSIQKSNTSGILYTTKQLTANHLLFKDNLVSSNDEYAQSAGLFVNGGEATIKSADFIGNKVYSATNIENYWANGGALLASNGITTFTATVSLKNNIAEALGLGGGKGGAYLFQRMLS